MSIEQIINKAKKIRGENSLEILKGEKEILERLMKLKKIPIMKIRNLMKKH